MITEFRLDAFERDQLVLQEGIGAFSEVVAIEQAFVGPGREVVRQNLVLGDVLRVQPLEQARDGRPESEACVHEILGTADRKEV